MTFLVCPDSFKGSISSVEAADAIERGLRSGFGNRPVEIVKVPLADGGEGTLDALVRANEGRLRRVRATDPLGREIQAEYGLIGIGAVAVVEMAAASGLCLLSDEERNPLVTSTYGTGLLIRAALDAGVSKIVVGIGGSATNDGGAGAMSALGARFLDSSGRELPPGGAALIDLHSIDLSDFAFPVGKVEVEVACDVTNPLIGPEGASAVYGPQKGASRDAVELLDKALARYAEIVRRDLGKDLAGTPGAGAAGGLGFGLTAFLDAKMRSGIEMVLDVVGFDQMLTRADLVITGEGRIDEQTAYGKTIGGVLKRALQAGVPVVAIAGSVSGDITPLYEAGLTAAFSIAPGPVSLEYMMENGAVLLEAVAGNVARLALELTEA